LRIHVRHAAVLEPGRGELVPDQSVLVAGTTIATVGGHEISAAVARVTDVRGKALMPGLIDAHDARGDRLLGAETCCT
jgi:imidazolonepropionase-like amidohydrolase